MYISLINKMTAHIQNIKILFIPSIIEIVVFVVFPLPASLVAIISII